MSILSLPLRMIPASVQAVVVMSGLNLLIDRKQAALSRLVLELEPYVFEVRLLDAGLSFFMGVRHGRFWVHAEYDGDPHVVVSAETSGFARMLFAREKPDDLVYQQVLKLEGDADAMMRFKSLLAEADLDWEAALREMFGDFFGAKVAEAAQSMIEKQQKLQTFSQQQLQKILTRCDIPGEKAVEAWKAQVEQCDRQLHKLERSILKLERSVAKAGKRAQKAKDSGRGAADA